MRFLRSSNRRRHDATCWLLVMLLFRAYVPTGFMPQTGHLLQLQVCPAGMPSHSLLSHAMAQQSPRAPVPEPGTHSTGSAAHVTDCPFRYSPVAGPIADGIVLTSAEPVLSQPLPAFDTRPAGMRSLRAHQARAPPTLA
jgi:hypothetical protein